MTAAAGARRLTLVASLVLAGCNGEGTGDPVLVTIPTGASFTQAVDSLETHGIVRAPWAFRLYGRVTGAASRIKAGTYAMRAGTGWQTVLGALEAGESVTARVVVPEGWDIARIAPRLAEALRLDPDSVLVALSDTSAIARWDVPGPSLEGYLYPATYTFALNTPLDSAIAVMVRTYRAVWTAERQARADSIDMDQRQVITLASIIEKEAVLPEEHATIASVYHNRLRIGYPLQADPTVQYALGGHRARLLYADIDSVADNPYNTYRIRGLPPGPIGSPSQLAIDAALQPADTEYLYFVARPDGSHVFTRSLDEHNRAKNAMRRLRDTIADSLRLDSLRADSLRPNSPPGR
ncbi:MAG TPA: endolytic transglycosylase MltG [Thermoanaerobaculia bacterium]|nr:endolytic transglycosylase MltG [Thermoanaerobaculia bacterium]